MNSTRIEWTHVFGPGSGFTWNPVVGCTRGCAYCYARRLARRQKQKCRLCYEYVPHLHEERLDQPLRRKKRSGVFIGSMTDLWDPNVPQAWRDRIWGIVEACPQHVFWVLTKQAGKLYNSREQRKLHDIENLWVGVSIEDGREELRWRFLAGREMQRVFISFEPLQWNCAAVPFDIFNAGWIHPARWVILGAETGNRTGKIVPKRKWLTGIVERAEAVGIPVFVKDNMISVMGEAYVRAHQQWPEAMKR